MNLNNRVYPTLQQFFKAAQQADQSDIAERNTADLYKIIKRAFLANPRIMGHYITRTTALSSFDWQIIGEDETAVNDARMRLKPAIDHILNSHAKTAFYGCNVYKLSVQPGNTGTVISIANELDHRFYDLDNENLYLLDNNGDITKKIDARDPVQTGYFVDQITWYLYKGGILRTLMPLEIIRFDIITENANYLRKLKGILQIVNKGASREEQSQAENAAQSAIQHNYVVTSDFVEFRLNQIAQSAGSNFKDYIDLLNRDIAISILGQANTAELPDNGGSRAALQIQKMISADIMYADMIRIEKLIDRLLLMDYRLNYNPNALEAPYTFAFKIAQEYDVEENASALETLSRFLPLKKEEAYRFVGFTPPAEGDELL